MEQSALPRQLLALTSGMCLMEGKQTSSEGRYWFSPAEARTRGNNTPMLSGFFGPPAPFPTWQQKGKHVLKALLSVVIMMSRRGPFFCWEGIEVSLLFSSCLDWELLYGCIFFYYKPGTRNTEAYLPLPGQTLGVIKWQNKKRKFFLLFYHQFWVPVMNKWWTKRGGIFIWCSRLPRVSGK